MILTAVAIMHYHSLTDKYTINHSGNVNTLMKNLL